mmetsp:Transcript_12891/g.17920  ORF Transcript_12891/g.17920 Transcript_12891/m.17920 type:complete len:291 (-) Transcript_12891:241-1113(-)
MSCVELHADLEMHERLAGLERFIKGHADYMISSDLGARGLDIQGVSCIVNLDAPRNLKTYIHRVGRTARIGLKGIAMTIFSEGDESVMREVLTVSKKGTERPHIRTLNISRTKIWRSRIRRYDGKVTRIMKEELRNKTERMQLLSKEKALNMRKHKEEIFRREKRTWFQTPAEKRRDKEAEALANGLIVGRQRQRLLGIKKRNLVEYKAQGTTRSSRQKKQQTKNNNPRNTLTETVGPKAVHGGKSHSQQLKHNRCGSEGKLKRTNTDSFGGHRSKTNVILDGPLIKPSD